jgi:hypothetical protein
MEDVIEVLLTDGWHAVVKGSFDMYNDEEDTGLVWWNIGANRSEGSEGEVVECACPFAAIQAARHLLTKQAWWATGAR